MFKLIFLTPIILIFFVYQGCSDGAFRINQDTANSMATQIGQIDLGDKHPSSFKTSSESSVQSLYYNRYLTFNLFVDIFGPSIEKTLVKEVAWASTEFGTAFGLYRSIQLPVAECNQKRSPYYHCRATDLDLTTSPTIGVTAPREARRMSACHRGISNENALSYAFGRIEKDSNVSRPPEPILKNYQRVYQLFFRGRPLPKESFFDHFQLIVDKEEDLKLAWEKIILGTCLSPHWQVH